MVCCLFIICSSYLTPSRTSPGKKVVTSVIPQPSAQPVLEEDANSLYESFGLSDLGLSKDAFRTAYKGYNNLKKKGRVDDTRYLTICDFSQSSRKKRLYVLDMENEEVVMNTFVAHGRNSGYEYATKFSNTPSSHRSSLGFYVTLNTYQGDHGLSLRLKGLEPGFNDKAYSRAIVIHGAGYIEDSYLNRSGRMGRSFGCPAIPKSESDEIINTIKDGTLVFVYHPTATYLKRSRILNG